MAGFISRKQKKINICKERVKVLTNSETEDCSRSRLKSLLTIKIRGGLTKPSEDVVAVCKVAEFSFKNNTNKISEQSNIIQYLTVKSASQLNINQLFTGISNHTSNQSPFNNHLLQIVNVILKTYLTIRLHHFDKTNSQPKLE